MPNLELTPSAESICQLGCMLCSTAMSLNSHVTTSEGQHDVMIRIAMRLYTAHSIQRFVASPVRRYTLYFHCSYRYGGIEGLYSPGLYVCICWLTGLEFKMSSDHNRG